MISGYNNRMYYESENIVIGSSINALLYGLITHYPVYYAECRKPHQFEFLNASDNLSLFSIESNSKIYKSFNDDFAFGVSKLLLWEKLYFLLSMEGLLPLSNLCHSIRYDGETLTCSTEYSKLCEIKFDKCYYFGDNRTYKLVKEKEGRNARYKVYDRIAFKIGGKHHIDYFETGDDFVSEVWFYSSDRIFGDTGVKDACVLSILTDDELADSSYTETISRFKMLSIMKENGMRGKPNGYTAKGTPRYYDFKTFGLQRQKIKLDNPDWLESTNIKKINLSTSELIDIVNNTELLEYDYLNGPKL